MPDAANLDVKVLATDIDPNVVAEGRAGEVLDLGTDLGLIEKSGSHYSLRGERIGQGREKAVEWLRERPVVVEELWELALGRTRPRAKR